MESEDKQKAYQEVVIPLIELVNEVAHKTEKFVDTVWSAAHILLDKVGPAIESVRQTAYDTAYGEAKDYTLEEIFESLIGNPPVDTDK